jgi:hypothetical protein
MGLLWRSIAGSAGMDPCDKHRDDGAGLGAWRETAESSTHAHLSSVIPVTSRGMTEQGLASAYCSARAEGGGHPTIRRARRRKYGGEERKGDKFFVEVAAMSVVRTKPTSDGFGEACRPSETV